MDYNLPNQYTLCSIFPILLPGRPQTATFATRNDSPIPDPRYLALHAVCVKITHLSCAGQYIDGVKKDIDTTPVLANDGSPSRVLAVTLNRISIVA